MPNFKPDNIRQRMMLDVDFLEVIGENTFEQCLYLLLERESMLSAFEACYKNDHGGRPAYEPKLLLRVILYAYWRGITSSRAIASLCRTDLKFMALAGGDTPHFTTIADFVSSKPDAIADVFTRVLLVCDNSGLIGKEHFSIDGCKLPSDASKQWSGTHEQMRAKMEKMRKLAERIIEKHRDNDSGKSELPEKDQQKVDTLLMNAQKFEDFLAENEPRIGEGKSKKEVQSNVTDNESAKMKTNDGVIQGFNLVTAADSKYQLILNLEAFGSGPEQHTLVPMIESIEYNLSIDLGKGETVVTADTGFFSEQNMKYVFDKGVDAIIPDGQFRQRQEGVGDSKTYQEHKQNHKKNRIDRARNNDQIPKSEFTVDLDAKICICPAGKELMYHGEREDKERGTYARFRGRLADCRDCSLSSKCMQNEVTSRGRQIQFLKEETVKSKYSDLMKQKIDSEEGAKEYSKRMYVIEPVFGNITSNKGLDELSLRGKAKVTGQGRLFALVHNISKLWRYGNQESMAV
jgi:transposase